MARKKSRPAKRRSQIKKPRKLKKIKAPKLAKIEQPETRDLKAAWSYLRKLGLIKSKRDGRKIKKNDKRARKQVAKFRDIFNGKAEVRTLTPQAAKAYKKAGEQVIGNKLIVKKKIGQKIKKRKGKIYKTEKISGGQITTILIPHSFVDLQRNMRVLEQDPEIVRLMNAGWKLSLRFKNEFGIYYGHAYIPKNGKGIERAFAELKEYVERYETVQKGTAFGALELIMVSSAFHRPQNKRIKHQRTDASGRSISGRRYKERKFKEQYPEAYAKHKAYMRRYMRKKRKTPKTKYKRR